MHGAPRPAGGVPGLQKRLTGFLEDLENSIAQVRKSPSPRLDCSMSISWIDEG